MHLLGRQAASVAANRSYPVALRRGCAGFWVGPEVLVATSCSRRRARLTEVLSGNVQARSGSSRTRLVPAAACLWYLPRTPPFRRDRSYSGRRLLPRRFANSFVILSLLPAGGPPRADNSDPTCTPGMCHEEHALSRGTTDRDLTILLFGVIRIRERHRQRVEKHRGGLLESNAMLLDVGRGFDPIPLVDHDNRLPRTSAFAKRSARDRVGGANGDRSFCWDSASATDPETRSLGLPEIRGVRPGRTFLRPAALSFRATWHRISRPRAFGVRRATPAV